MLLDRDALQLGARRIRVRPLHDARERRAHLRRVTQVQLHAARLGFVHDLGRNDLQHDRKADRLRRVRRCLGTDREARADRGDAVGGEQRHRIGAGQVLAARGARVVEERACGGVIDIEASDRARRALEPDAVTVHGGQRACGGLGEDVRGNPDLAQLRASLGQTLTPHEHREYGLVRVRARGIHDGRRDIDLTHPERRHERRNRGAHAVVGQNRVQRQTVVVGGRGRDHVHGIADAGLVGQIPPQPLLRGGCERRDAQPCRLACVRDDDAGPARVRDDGDAVVTRDRQVTEGHRQVEQLLHGVDPDHAALREQRIDGGVGRRQ